MTSWILGSKPSDSNEGMKSMKSCTLPSCWSNADEFKRPELYFCPVDGAWVDEKPTGEMYFEKSFPNNEELHDPKEVRENISGEAMSSVSVNVNCAVCVEELTEFLSKQKSITTLTVDVNIPRRTMTGWADKLAEALAKIPSLSTLTLNIKGQFDMVADLAHGLANSTSLTTLAINFSRNYVEDCDHQQERKEWFFYWFLNFYMMPVDHYNLAVGLARSTSLTTLTLCFDDFFDFDGFHVFDPSPRHWRLKRAANSVEALVKSESLTTLNLCVGSCTVMRVFFSASYVFLDGDWAHELANCLEKRLQLPILTVDTSISDNVIEGWAYYMENGFTSLSTLSLNIHNAVYIKEGLSHTLMNSLVKSTSLTSLTLNITNPGNMKEGWVYHLANDLAKSTSLTTLTLNVNNPGNIRDGWANPLTNILSKSPLLTTLEINIKNPSNMSKDWANSLANGLGKSTTLTTLTLRIHNPGNMRESWANSLMNGLAKSTSLTALTLGISNPGYINKGWEQDLTDGLAKSTSITAFTLDFSGNGNRFWIYNLANGLAKSTSVTSLTLDIKNTGNMTRFWVCHLANGLAKSTSLTSLTLSMDNPPKVRWTGWAQDLAQGLAKSSSLTTLTLNINNYWFRNVRSRAWFHDLANGWRKARQ